jgi:CelD/BcsL family acetyltransferase involved in cellulose biosynthesis
MSKKRKPIAADLLLAHEYPRLADDWLRLEASADSSPFSSWAWISTWLDHLPARFKPLVFCARDDEGPLGMGLVVAAAARSWRRLLGGHILYMQETGDPVLDRLTIEFGGLVTRRGAETRAYASFFRKLSKRHRWRALKISASTQSALVLSTLPAHFRAFLSQRRPSYLVDLAGLRDTRRGYIESLGSGSARHKLRRTLRDYGKLGELRMEIATDADRALEYLGELTVFHEQYWKSKGRTGSFGEPFFFDFHRDFVSRHAASGLAQLSRITAGDSVVGYCYHLVWRNHVYYYNSGLRYGVLGANEHPGYLAHVLSIENALARGMLTYDFLAGDAAYKRTLSSHANTMDWISIKPPGFSLALDRVLESVRLRRSRLDPLTPPPPGKSPITEPDTA